MDRATLLSLVPTPAHFHRAACRALGFEVGQRGSLTQVANRVGESPSSYHGAVKGLRADGSRTSPGRVSQWMVLWERGGNPPLLWDDQDERSRQEREDRHLGRNLRALAEHSGFTLHWSGERAVLTVLSEPPEHREGESVGAVLKR